MLGKCSTHSLNHVPALTAGFLICFLCTQKPLFESLSHNAEKVPPVSADGASRLQGLGGLGRGHSLAPGRTWEGTQINELLLLMQMKTSWMLSQSNPEPSAKALRERSCALPTRA